MEVGAGKARLNRDPEWSVRAYRLILPAGTARNEHVNEAIYKLNVGVSFTQFLLCL